MRASSAARWRGPAPAQEPCGRSGRWRQTGRAQGRSRTEHWSETQPLCDRPHLPHRGATWLRGAFQLARHPLQTARAIVAASRCHSVRPGQEPGPSHLRCTALSWGLSGLRAARDCREAASHVRIPRSVGDRGPPSEFSALAEISGLSGTWQPALFSIARRGSIQARQQGACLQPRSRSSRGSARPRLGQPGNPAQPRFHLADRFSANEASPSAASSVWRLRAWASQGPRRCRGRSCPRRSPAPSPWSRPGRCSCLAADRLIQDHKYASPTALIERPVTRSQNCWCGLSRSLLS